jgi:hypothetical protein
MKTKWYSSALMIMALLVGVFVIGIVQDANALFVLTLDDLSTVGIDVIVSDNALLGTPTKKGVTTVLDGTATVGAVSFNGVVGTFSVNVTTGVSKPVIGGFNVSRIDLNSINVSGSAAGQLKIELTDTDFSLPVSPNPYTLKSFIGGTTDGTVDLDQFVDLSNNEFGIGPPGPNIPLVLSQGPFGPGAFSGTASGNINIVNPFSITEEVLITHTAAGNITSFNAGSDVAIPEPTTLILFGFGLVGVAGFAWHRKKKQG